MENGGTETESEDLSAVEEDDSYQGLAVATTDAGSSEVRCSQQTQQIMEGEQMQRMLVHSRKESIQMAMDDDDDGDDRENTNPNASTDGRILGKRGMLKEGESKEGELKRLKADLEERHMKHSHSKKDYIEKYQHIQDCAENCV